MSGSALARKVFSTVILVLAVLVALGWVYFTIIGDPFELGKFLLASGEASGEATAETVDNLPVKPVYVPKELTAEQLDKIFSNEGQRNIYSQYEKKYANVPRPEQDIVIEAETAVSTGENISVVDNFNGAGSALKWEGDGTVQLQVDVPADGVYKIEMVYWPLVSTNRDIEMSMKINGETPFDGALRIVFNKLWHDQSKIVSDSRKNDIRPRQEQVEDWTTVPFKDHDGTAIREYSFYFKKGVNTIELDSKRTGMVIDKLRLYNDSKIMTYDEYRSSITAKKLNGIMDKYNAEETFLKSDPSIVPNWDRSGPNTYPSDPSALKLNIIGGNNWKQPGQWVSWKINVKEEGDYKIAFRYRQNFIRGFFTSRRVTIDGEMPFAELAHTSYTYGDEWQVGYIGDGTNPYLIHLTPGDHILSMEVTPGELGETIQTLSDSVYMLNYVYREIITITSTTPDVYRDYNLDNDIDNLQDKFFTVSNWLKAEVKRLEALTGTKSGEISILEKVSFTLDQFTEDPEQIIERMEAYKANVSSLSSLMMAIQEQPIEFDTIYVMSEEQEAPAPMADFLSNFNYQVAAFIGSFYTDYSSIGDLAEGKKLITVWFSGSREQAEIVKHMIDDTFTQETGIAVNLELAQIGLSQAIIAGNAPDVMMQVGRGDPVNLAARGALVDLSKLEGFDEVKKRFHDTAMIPYTFLDGAYGIPITSDYHMMFYRTDIFNQLGIKPPETWDDLYKIIPIVQRNNMAIGLPFKAKEDLGVNTGLGTNDVFTTLLLQRGGSIYNNNLSAVALDSQTSLEVFKEWTEFYSKYKFPLEYDFYNRFRTGEMPLGIASYGMYNFLSAAAPEIRGLWEMTLIPGTLMPDGTINRAEGASGSATVIPKTTKDVDSAWKFVKWWSGAEAQERYGRELEILMGAASRYGTANEEAMQRLPWSAKELDILLNQKQSVVEIPEAVGGYYTTRSIGNAFRNVFFLGNNPREALYEQIIIANSEIERKRNEFHLN